MVLIIEHVLAARFALARARRCSLIQGKTIADWTPQGWFVVDPKVVPAHPGSRNMPASRNQERMPAHRRCGRLFHGVSSSVGEGEIVLPAGGSMVLERLYCLRAIPGLRPLAWIRWLLGSSHQRIIVGTRKIRNREGIGHGWEALLTFPPT